MSEAAAEGAPRRLFASPTLWAGILSVVAAYPIATLIVGDPFAVPVARYGLIPVSEDPSDGPVFVVPHFELVNEAGEAFGAEQLRGHVWVASFFFTSCPTICPKLSARLVELQSAFEKSKSSVKMVTFTVDPQTDTPDVLAEHARELGADPERWHFVTGEPGDLEKAVVEGFKQPMGAPEDDSDAATAMAIAHGVRFVLVDRSLGVRGLYDPDEPGLKTLLQDAADL